ncbi:Uncharacterised protein [uncultured archaeon]|nr:Uncharacterised protein [uncultured archaeon]
MVYVTKHSGEREEFDPQKVEYALLRSGADKTLAQYITEEVKRRLYDGIKTGEIYAIAFELLSKSDTHTAARFGLKQAIMRLGPSGYTFEKFMSRVLAEYGYKTKINQTIPGRCALHEVDIVAENGKMKYMIECKYHNTQGMDTGLKEALYSFARFEDLRDAGNDFTAPWIICNTKVTTEAVKYAECKGMRVTSWGYPPQGSLQELIDGKSLYPLTMLATLTEDEKNKLANSGEVLLQDLISMDARKLAEITGVPEGKLKPLEEEIRGIATNLPKGL